MPAARDSNRLPDGWAVLYICKSEDVCLWLFLEELREFSES